MCSIFSWWVLAYLQDPSFFFLNFLKSCKIYLYFQYQNLVILAGSVTFFFFSECTQNCCENWKIQGNFILQEKTKQNKTNQKTKKKKAKTKTKNKKKKKKKSLTNKPYLKFLQSLDAKNRVLFPPNGSNSLSCMIGHLIFSKVYFLRFLAASPPQPSILLLLLLLLFFFFFFF